MKRIIWFQDFFKKKHFVPNRSAFCDRLHPTRFHLLKYVLKKQSVSHGPHVRLGWEISEQIKNKQANSTISLSKMHTFSLSIFTQKKRIAQTSIEKAAMQIASSQHVNYIKNLSFVNLTTCRVRQK